MSPLPGRRQIRRGEVAARTGTGGFGGQKHLGRRVIAGSEGEFDVQRLGGVIVDHAAERGLVRRQWTYGDVVEPSGRCLTR
ncbi:hypothetical protein FH609_002450 [Streptomyces sp. 3MP-14]|uniref:Uncharacterized protein n=1 Tax=Streptomyces mimosae TaxID=2586635 RepID=A0A5N6AQ39_9ACTN|nr:MULTISPECIES: hypothetical protein [Streptomyces]KAB8170791.1 hypothetical protein FH607_000020 [Streptomyces mimosae]KAB8179856.1 hypothetical protein FH609_002450 [Streptomyces sp. 3MP-14]